MPSRLFYLTVLPVIFVGISLPSYWPFLYVLLWAILVISTFPLVRRLFTRSSRAMSLLRKTIAPIQSAPTFVLITIAEGMLVWGIIGYFRGPTWEFVGGGALIGGVEGMIGLLISKPVKLSREGNA
jgi:hypothetical protein